MAGVPQGPLPGAPKEGDIKIPAGTMPSRPLGSTGVTVSAVGLGGYHIGIPEEAEAIRIIHAAIDHGVSFLDNCWDYNDGRSEERMGKALARSSLRQKVVLMTKLDGRDRVSAAAQLEQSLRRLRTDVIDLVQVHEVIRDDDPDRVFAAGGAMEALIAARKAGQIRFIGFTGHKDPDIHNRMLDVAAGHGFAFDTVQMPLNPMDPHYRSFERGVLPRLVASGVGVLGMKPMASGLLLESGAVQATECLRYALSLPTSVVITGCDSMGVLEQALAAAIGFTPMSDTERQALLARTRPHADRGQHEKFKTSEMFDGTTEHPRWLDSAQI
jgi:aryl-alcohol dehydrogenase-like predicted oxidoreductase